MNFSSKTLGFLVCLLLSIATVGCDAPTPDGPSQSSVISGQYSSPYLPTSNRSIAARERVIGDLRREAASKGLKIGAPIFIRSFKQEKYMEVWMQAKRGGTYKRFKTFDVCSYPGPLGPKQRNGDLMIPEGFYRVDGRALNPNSDFHLSFDLGYPNPLERSLGRTGYQLMVHGGCESIGCYAIGDNNIEKLYTLVFEALKGGQAAIEFHAYPFVMG